MKDRFYSVSIIKDPEKFALRIGFSHQCSLSDTIQKMLIDTAEILSIDEPKEDILYVYRRTWDCSFGVYRESDEESYSYYITERSFKVFDELRMNFNNDVKKYRKHHEKIGQNFLVQQLKEDVLGKQSK